MGLCGMSVYSSLQFQNQKECEQARLFLEVPSGDENQHCFGTKRSCQTSRAIKEVSDYTISFI